MQRCQLIERQYGLSPRLVGSMLMDPWVPQLRSSDPTGSRHSSFKSRSSDPVDRSSLKHSSHIMHDAEKGSSGEDQDQKSVSSDGVLDLNHYQIVDEVWHFASVDWSSNCEADLSLLNGDSILNVLTALCLGFNTLHNGWTSKKRDVEGEGRARDLPHGKRVWSWLLLCSDGRAGCNNSLS